METITTSVQFSLDFYNNEISKILSAYFSKNKDEEEKIDVIFIGGGIRGNLDEIVRYAMTRTKKDDHTSLAIILNTTGGSPFIAERIVQSVRTKYKNVYFIVNDMAMSAGTILVTSGDEIIMSATACLGPIDVQVFYNGRYIPAASYLDKFDELYKKASNPNYQLNTAELAILEKFDPVDLKEFQESMNLGIELVKNWLATYKFRNWKKAKNIKASRAKKIANILANHAKWHSHGRPISREILASKDINLKILAIELIENLERNVKSYESLAMQWMSNKKFDYFVHSLNTF